MSCRHPVTNKRNACRSWLLRQRALLQLVSVSDPYAKPLPSLSMSCVCASLSLSLGQQIMDDKIWPRSIKAIPAVQFCMPAFELDPSKGLACSKVQRSPPQMKKFMPSSYTPQVAILKSLMKMPHPTNPSRKAFARP